MSRNLEEYKYGRDMPVDEGRCVWWHVCVIGGEDSVWVRAETGKEAIETVIKIGSKYGLHLQADSYTIDGMKAELDAEEKK